VDAEKLAELKDVIEALSTTPKQIEQLLHGLPAQSLRLRSSPDEFSATENVCHLRDLEVEGYAIRIERLLGESKPELSDFEGARIAAERDYNNEDVFAALREFALARAGNVTAVHELKRDQLQRTGSLAGVGEITVARLLEMMLEHDEGHLDELKRISRLTLKPTDDV
jgi:hypothetical protein